MQLLQSARHVWRAHAVITPLLLLLLLGSTVHARVLLQNASSPPAAGTPGLYVPLLPANAPAPPSPSPSPNPTPGLYVPYVIPPDSPEPSDQPQAPGATLPPSAASPPPPSPPQQAPTPQAPSPSPQPPSPLPSPAPSPTVSPPQPQPAVPEAGPAPVNASTNTTPPAATAGGQPAAPVAAPASGTSSSTNGSGSKGLSTGALVGIIVGIAAAAALAAGIIILALMRRKKHRAAAAAGAAPKGIAGATAPPAFSGYDDSDPPGGPPHGPAGSSGGPGSQKVLPSAPTWPIPQAVQLAEPPNRVHSGPAALADHQAAAPALGATTPGLAAPGAPPAYTAAQQAAQPVANNGPAAAGDRLEGWLAHSAAAAAAAGPNAGPACPAWQAAPAPVVTPDPSYPQIDPLLQRPPAAGYHRGAAAHFEHHTTPAIPEDMPLHDSFDTNSNDMFQGAGWQAGQPRTSADTAAGPRGGVVPAAAAAGPTYSPPNRTPFMTAGGPQQRTSWEQQQRTSWEQQQRTSWEQQQRMSWEQQQQQPSWEQLLALQGRTGSAEAHTWSSDTADRNTPAAFGYQQPQQQQPRRFSDDAAPVADIGASPFAHLFHAPGSLQSSVMSKAASGPLSPVAMLPGQSPTAAGPLQSVLADRHATAAAAPAGAGATVTAAAGAGPAHSRAVTGVASVSGSPFAAGFPAFGDGSLSAAVMAVSAAAPGSPHSNTPGNDGSEVRSGPHRPPRYSPDTSSSSSAAGRSWSSAGSSSTAATRPPAAAAAVGTRQATTSGSHAASTRQVAPSAPAGGGGGGKVLAMQASVAPKPTRFMSGPHLDPNWDFGQSGAKPVRVLLQVNDEDTDQPVRMILVCSAPPPKPEVLAQIVLPADPPQAGVDLAIDLKTALAFPSNSFLGAGAFGQVHRALYEGRFPVAVKMLTDPDLRCPDPETLRSFREELSIMVRLQHPHILRCYGGNLEGSNPFIVTELCECSLDKMLLYYRKHHSTGLPLRHTLTVGLHVASALWHLHPSIVHRDLKPQNVLLDINGTAKVADFGLSRMKVHTYLSTQHVTAGTAGYMAPECFEGAAVGEKADIYSLGCMLWECVTGERPWKGLNVVQVAYQVAMAHNKPQLPAVDPETCPHELVQLIDDCWAHNPRERPSSGEVMKLVAQMMRVYLQEPGGGP